MSNSDDKASITQSKEEPNYAVYAESVASPADIEVDAVFGERKEGGVDYRSVGWIKAALLLTKTQIALGVLALPSVLTVLGGVPGALTIVAVGVMTTWSDVVIGKFKLRHPEVYTIDDVGFILAGRVGREFFSIAYILLFVALVGSGLVSIAIAFNAVTLHATCTVAWVAIAAFVTFLLASVQTLNKISILGWIGLASVMSAILTIVIAVTQQDRPAAAPATGPWDKDIHAFSSTPLLGAMAAVSTVVFSYCGSPAFLNVVSEMRRPQDFTKAVVTCQTIVTAVYLTIAVVVWWYCGQYVSSPALGSAGPLLKRISYAIALPGLFVSITIYTHVVSKMVFVRILRGTHHLTENTVRHWVVWLGSVAACVIAAFIIAESIPVFGDLVGLIGALLGSMMCMQSMGVMWLFDNWARRHTDKTLLYRALVVFNIFLILSGFFVQITGTWASVIAIRKSAAQGGASSFSCADNSGP